VEVCATEHCHPEIAQAIEEQSRKLIHICGADYYYSLLPELASKLSDIAPMRTGRGRRSLQIAAPRPSSASDRLAVTSDALPGHTFTGKVTFVAKKGEFTPRNIQTRDDRERYLFASRLEVEDPQRLLRPGMAAEIQLTEPPERH
jgi:hypothetical protein